MNKLWVWLTLAFGLVTVMAVMVASVLANIQVSNQFRHFVSQDQMMNSRLVPILTEYYTTHRQWQGIETVLDDFLGSGAGMMMGQGQGSGPGQGQRMRYGAPQFVLADAQGRIVYGEGASSGSYLDSATLSEALSLEVQSQIVGYLTVTAPGQFQLTGPAQSFLGQLNRALFGAGLIAGILGLLLGLIIARGLSAPLGRVAAAARKIAQGHLDQQVPVQGSEEVADLALAFNEMATHLKQAEEVRRNMVADIAHELRTPLSVIQGNLQAILDGVYPLEQSEIADIYEETLTLNRLIKDLRELTQAEAGQLTLNLQPISLPLLIENVLENFAELAREKQVHLKRDLPPKLPPVQADPDRIRQVLHNLLANALRYTPPEGKITVEVSLSSDFVTVSIRDTGAGIAAEDLPHLFNRFWRADKSRSREQGGSGLGLAIAQQLIQAHGGEIGVESKGVAGQGSRFWFTLPYLANSEEVM